MHRHAFPPLSTHRTINMAADPDDAVVWFGVDPAADVAQAADEHYTDGSGVFASDFTRRGWLLRIWGHMSRSTVLLDEILQHRVAIQVPPRVDLHFHHHVALAMPAAAVFHKSASAVRDSPQLEDAPILLGSAKDRRKALLAKRAASRSIKKVARAQERREKGGRKKGNPSADRRAEFDSSQFARDLVAVDPSGKLFVASKRPLVARDTVYILSASGAFVIGRFISTTGSWSRVSIDKAKPFYSVRSSWCRVLRAETGTVLPAVDAASLTPRVVDYGFYRWYAHLLLTIHPSFYPSA